MRKAKERAAAVGFALLISMDGTHLNKYNIHKFIWQKLYTLLVSSDCPISATGGENRNLESQFERRTATLVKVLVCVCVYVSLARMYGYPGSIQSGTL